METLAGLMRSPMVKDFPIAKLRSFIPRLRALLPQAMMFAPAFGFVLTDEQAASIAKGLDSLATDIVSSIGPGNEVGITLNGVTVVRLVAR